MIFPAVSGGVPKSGLENDLPHGLVGERAPSRHGVLLWKRFSMGIPVEREKTIAFLIKCVKMDMKI